MERNRSRSSGGSCGAPVPVRRRGSVEETSSDQQPISLTEISCPKCHRPLETALMMAGCSHRVCRRCAENLFTKSQMKKCNYHCPVCNEASATSPDVLRRDRDLEAKVRNYRQSQLRDRRHTESSGVCHRLNCNARADGNEPCPHCGLRLCRIHFEEDCKLVKQCCLTGWDNVDNHIESLQAFLENCKVQKNNIDNMIDENKRAHGQLLRRIETQFRNSQKELEKCRLNVSTEEEKINEILVNLHKLQKEMDDALSVEEDDRATLKQKHKLATLAENLTSNIQTPNLPEDVRFNYTSADTEEIEKKIEKLRVLQNSLDVHVVDRQTIKQARPEKEFTPHQAVLWSHTEEFCLDSKKLVQRRTPSSCDGTKALPDEVLIVTDMMKLYVLSLDGETLGQIKVYDGASPFVAKYLSLSPDGRRLVLLSKRKVLLCDMDGTVEKEIPPNSDSEDKICRLHGLCSATLSEKHLMIVAPGNTRHNKPGAVFILEGPQFNFSEAKKIPLDSRKLFPTGVTHARGSCFVLANRASVQQETELDSNELLMYDAKSCKLVAEMPCSDELQSALYICSDDRGRIFVSVSRWRQSDQSDSSSGQSASAEVIVLDPQGRRIGSIGANDGLATCNGISISDSRAKTGRPSRLVVCDATQRLVHVYTLSQTDSTD